MAQIPAEVQEVFNEVRSVVFATATPGAQPNACIVGMKAILDDHTVYLSDQFFRKTLANVLANPKVAIVFWNEKGAYQIHGTARYVNEGPEFEAQAAWVNEIFEKRGAPYRTKGGVFVDVDAVFSSNGGPTAGDQIA